MADTVELDFGWRASIERVGEWLAVRLHPNPAQPAPGMGLVEGVWRAVHQRGDLDVVLEMDEVEFFPSLLMGELVRLHKRLATHGGRLRLCRLREHPAEALRITRLDRVLPIFPDRAAAAQ